MHVWSETSRVEEPSLGVQKDEMVMLGKIGTRIIQYSRMNDYLYRPVEMRHWSLYEFLRYTKVGMKPLPSKRKRTGHFANPLADEIIDVDADAVVSGNEVEMEEITTDRQSEHTYYEFAEGHPNRDTHGVYVLKNGHWFVLNYVGAALPRRDHGDREYYCKVMLMIFCAGSWHDGSELKQESETWDSTFASSTFTSRALKIMANMNLIYEYLDAHYDYAALHKAGELSSIYSLGAEVMDSLDADSRNAQMEGIEVTDEDLQAIMEEAAEKRGKQSLKVWKEMETMRDLMFQMDVEAKKRFPLNAFSESNEIDGNAFQDTEKMGPEWKKILDDTRDALVQARAAFTRVCELHSSSREKLSSSGDNGNNLISNEGSVEVVSDAMYKMGDVMDRTDVVEHPTSEMAVVKEEFSLNEEQYHAFMIIAGHLTWRWKDPLLMYLRGMGDTGKLQVIKAVMSYLTARNESHYFLVLALMGAVASLVDGSTYHSVLGFSRDDSAANGTKLAKVRKCLALVDFIFIDEISMMSCRDLYCISARLSCAFDLPLVVFGGKSMCVSGDFAQLLPAGTGHLSLYSSSVSLGMAGLTLSGQQNAMGKAIWHQFTTIVILRQNMRQASSSKADIQFRQALENMRYRRCTEDNLHLLRSHILGIALNQPHLGNPRFRNVSVITGLNSHHDAINEASVTHFAEENSHIPHTFYSHDRWAAVGRRRMSSLKAVIHQAKHFIDPARTSNAIS